MGFLFLLFGVVLSLCVVGLVVIALAAILGRVRDDWKLKRRSSLLDPHLSSTDRAVAAESGLESMLRVS
jgi:hypothetical protein